MGPVKRIVVHDRHPWVEPTILRRPLNRAVLAVAGLTLVIQAVALVQVLMGQGFHVFPNQKIRVGPFDHTSFAVVAFLWWALGLFVFLQRRAHRAGQLFLLSASAGSIFMALGTLYRDANRIDSLLYAAGILFMPPLLFSFTRALDMERKWRREELLLFLPPLLLEWPAADALYARTTSPWWRAALVVVAGYLAMAVVQTFYDLRRAQSPEQAAQTRALLFGLVAGTMPAVGVFVVPIVATATVAVPVSWLPPIILVFLVAMSYAVLLFEFTDADLIVRRGVVYGVLTCAVILAYGVLGVLLTASSSTVTSPAGGLSFVVVTVLIGAAFGPIRRAARRLVDWLLYGGQIDRWEVLQELSRRLATVMQPDDLGDVLVHEITRALHLRGAFLLRRIDGTRFEVGPRAQSAESDERTVVAEQLSLDCATVESALGNLPMPLLLIHARPLTAGQYDKVPERYRPLDDVRSALTIPLVTRSGLEAVLCLERKLAHDAFDADDLELLAPVIRQATAALDNALLFSRLEEKVEELRHAYLRIAREQEAERARLARELHDGTAQELAGLIALAAVAERQMEGNGSAARSTLDRLRRQAEDAYQGVRRSSHALRPLMLDDFGLAPTLGRYLQQFEEATGIKVEFLADGVDALPDDVELALFRVAQECMENVRKHSGAQHASLRLERCNGRIRLSVADEGRGMMEDGERGIGLVGIRERIEAVGGEVRVESSPGHGVQIEAEIPVGEV